MSGNDPQQEANLRSLLEASGNGANSDLVLNDDEALVSMLQRRIVEMQYNSNFLDQLQLFTQIAMPVQRPREQFLTVANNGIILGATDTVTGFPPDSLLMAPV